MFFVYVCILVITNRGYRSIFKKSLLYKRYSLAATDISLSGTPNSPTIFGVVFFKFYYQDIAIIV